MSAVLMYFGGPDASGWHVHLLCTCVPEASHNEETDKTSVRAYAHMCARASGQTERARWLQYVCAHVYAETRDARHAIPKDLSTCVRTCVRAIRLPMLDVDAYVALMMARQWLFLSVPRHRLPGRLSISSLLFEMRGSVRPLAGMPWLLPCDTPCFRFVFRSFVVSPGSGSCFPGPFRRVPGVFSTRRWTPVFAMVLGCFGVSGFAWVRVLV